MKMILQFYICDMNMKGVYKYKFTGKQRKRTNVREERVLSFCSMDNHPKFHLEAFPVHCWNVILEQVFFLRTLKVSSFKYHDTLISG